MSGKPEQYMRLADYFVVVGFREDSQKAGIGSGIVLQRFPVRDWEDVPFISEIELFCQPQGWRLALESEEPKYFVSVLTDMIGNRFYCACLSFHEAIALTPSKPVDEQEEGFEDATDSYSPIRQSPASTTSSSPTATHHMVMYAPKCLVLMSRLYQIETFRQCLGTIYTAYSENLGVSLESLVGKLLGHVHIPLGGGQQVRFSLGGGDRQALQMPLVSSIPVSNSVVAQLFQQLGINNVLILFCAVMTEQKILFHSSCINRLTDACHALTCLMFPFRYSHVYVPILPSSITEVACSPTPFIIGVLSSARLRLHEYTDLLDVIVADLDGGSLTVPDETTIPTLPTLLWTHMQEQLTLVLHPELSSADNAFPPLAIKCSTPCQMDKEIRAVFLRMFAQLFQGYRSCLIIIRIHPKPFITFHKAKFLGKRGLCDNEFVNKLLECMVFNQFISERGNPWRACDVWDDLYSHLEEQLKQEAEDPKLVLVHIQELAMSILQNENPSPTTYVPKIIKPPDGAHLRIHTPAFPQLEPAIVTEVVKEGLTKQTSFVQSGSRYPSGVSKVMHPRLVQMGPKCLDLLDSRQQHLVDNSARRLEVLRNCVECIFENKISDARKTFHAVTRALKNHTAKLALCQELKNHIYGAKPLLNAQQFDMIVKLMHCALQDVGVMDEHGVAAAILPLACDFYRKLSANVKQFAYTMIQEHSVWKNQQFWEAVFYTEVEKEIKKLYLPNAETNSFSGGNSQTTLTNNSSNTNRQSTYENHQTPSNHQMLRSTTSASNLNNNGNTNNTNNILNNNMVKLKNEHQSIAVRNSFNGTIPNSNPYLHDPGTGGRDTGRIESGGYHAGSTPTRPPPLRPSLSVIEQREAIERREQLNEKNQSPSPTYPPLGPPPPIPSDSTIPPPSPPAPPQPTEYSALEIAAEQFRINTGMSQDKLKFNVSIEESTIVAQAVHFISRMTYMLVPLDTPSRRHTEKTGHGHHGHGQDHEERSSNITSMAESDSIGGESGFEDHDAYAEAGAPVKRFIVRFIDKVCTEGGVTEEHIRKTHNFVSTCVDMHLEECENVYKETKRLPPVQKPRIPTPYLVPGEQMVMESLRVYLLPDERDDAFGGPVILPAEGALFFTNYRLIFRGTPCDPYACEQQVVRSFPVSSLTKEKRITVQYLAHLDQLLQEGLQLRSATFQLMKLAFDEEVSTENIETFRKQLHKYRHPSDIFHYFAFVGQLYNTITPLSSAKDKSTTIRGFTKKAIQMTAKKAGIKTKHSKRQKYVLRTWAQGSNAGTLPASTKYGMGGMPTSPNKLSPPSRGMDNQDGDDLSLSEEDFPTVPALMHHSVANDSKSMERMMERTYYKDWKRIGLGILLPKSTNSSASSILQKAESFRISFANSTYLMCRSYPSLVVVPNLINDESMKKVARCYRSGRFPVITWRHPRTRALLIRGAAFNSKGLMAFFKGHPHAAAAGVSDATAHVEHETFLRALVNATPLGVMKPGLGAAARNLSDSTLSLDSVYTGNSAQSLGSHMHGDAKITPEVGRKNPFLKAMNTLRYAGTSGGKGIKNYTNWSATRARKPVSGANHAMPMYTNVSQMSVEKESHGYEGVTRIHKAALYIFGEKSQIKGIKPEGNSKIEYVPVDFSDVRHARTAFKKLMRACLPSSSGTFPDMSFWKAVEGSDWLNQLSSIMQLTAATVDLIDEGASVMFCMEDGSDITTQVVSLAQICLDPHYRTMEGFQTLIEKEWLGFGHRFAHRNNMTGSEGPSSNPGFAPIFFQFLDIVHQLLVQFPLSFEFNDFFLKFLAYHSVSARFRTFLADNELERVEYGFMAVDDKRSSLPRHYKGTDVCSDDESHYLCLSPAGGKSIANVNSQQQYCGLSIWEYIERHHARTPMFYNFKYEKIVAGQSSILRPVRHVSALELWDFYTNENLANGPPYDLETIHGDVVGEEEQLTEVQNDNRQCVMAGYDITDNHIPSAFSHYLNKFHQLEVDKGLLPQKWKQVWEKLELPAEDELTLTREPSFTLQHVRSLSRSLHRKSTLDILVRGKMVRSTDMSGVYNHSHRFDKHTFTTLTNCDICSLMLLGKTGLRCVECGAKCHEKCADSLPKCGAKYSKPSNDNMTSSNTTQGGALDNSSVSSNTPSLQTNQSYYDQFQATIAENRTHEGYLHKRGALLKAWKQRWFVLDSIKHQLRYYDAMEDSHSKGFIELSEVMSVAPALPTQGAPKKADEKAFFDIRTTRRAYNFLASDAAAAQEWIEKINACLLA